MAPLPPLDLANVYTAIVEYSVIAQPETKWRNTYDFHSAVAPTGSADIVAALAAYAPGWIFNNSQMDSIKVYNWSKGTQPYPNGLPILDIVYNTVGHASTAWTLSDTYAPMGNEVCLRVDKEHSGIGRPGRFFIRNFLPDTQVQATYGNGWELISGTHITQSALAAWITSSGVVNFLAGHVDPTTQQCFCTVQYSSKAHEVHGFNYDSNWIIVDVTTNKPTRKSKR